jgi:DNA-binding MarR family transcriptional regulator
VDNAADLSACRDCYCLASRRAARTITRLYDEKLRPHGLRSTQFSILAALALKGPTPMGELAELLGLEHTTLTRSAARLEREGWITTTVTTDTRKRPLELTPPGRRKLEHAFPAWKEVQEFISQHGPDAHKQTAVSGRNPVGPDRQTSSSDSTLQNNSLIADRERSTG